MNYKPIILFVIFAFVLTLSSYQGTALSVERLHTFKSTQDLNINAMDAVVEVFKHKDFKLDVIKSDSCVCCQYNEHVDKRWICTKGIKDEREVRKGLDKKYKALLEEYNNSLTSPVKSAERLPSLTCESHTYGKEYKASMGDDTTHYSEYVLVYAEEMWNVGQLIYKITRNKTTSLNWHILSWEERPKFNEIEYWMPMPPSPIKTT